MTPELEAATLRAMAEEERKQAEPAEPHWVQFLEMGMEFAYQQGLHEVGYNPITTLRAHLAMTDELLAALRAIVKSLADHDEEGLIEHAEQMQNARAAIAKAERK